MKTAARYIPRWSLALLLGLAGPIAATEVDLTVNGMVCAFCAQGVAEILREEPPVADVLVDMDNSLVRVNLREGATATDAEFQQWVKDAGYEVAAVHRPPQSTAAVVAELSARLGAALPSVPTTAYSVAQADGSTRFFLTLRKEDTRRWSSLWTSTNATAEALSDAPAWWAVGQALRFAPHSPAGAWEGRVTQLQLASTGTAVVLTLPANG